MEHIKQHFGRLARHPKYCGALQGAAKTHYIMAFLFRRLARRRKTHYFMAFLYRRLARRLERGVA